MDMDRHREGKIKIMCANKNMDVDMDTRKEEKQYD
jgi:hypothetical protein